MKKNGLFRYSLAVVTVLGLLNAESFNPEKDYLIENEFNGQILGQYTSNPPQLGPRILTNDKWIHIFTKEENGKKYVSFASPYGMQNSDPNKYKRFATPEQEGGTLTLKENGAIWWELIPHKSKDGKHYGFYYFKNRDTGLYMRDTTSIENSLNLRAPDRSNGGAIVSASKLDDPDDRRFLWKITEFKKSPPEKNLALPQSGWTPKANKIAVFSTKNRGSEPTFRVLTKNGKELFSGKGVYWGQYWDDLHFYTLNLNDKKLEKEGSYKIEVDGIEKDIYIKADTFIHPMRNYGAESFSLSEIFSPDFGFVTQWGRLTNWWPKAYEFLSSLDYWSPWDNKSPNTFPEWMWRDDSDGNHNGITYESYGGKASYEEANSCYEGGWDMTDQYAHNYALDGLVLYELSMLYKNSTNKKLKDKIYKEILYGVNGLLKRQEQDGSWRQGYMDKLKWTGTNAGLGSGLASTLSIISERDANLASKVKSAVEKSWNYVKNRAGDATTWAVAKKGKLPDGSTVAKNLPSQRNFWRESYLLFAINMYLNTKDDSYKKIIEDEVKQGTIYHNGWVKKYGGEFPGQFTAHGEWALVGLMKFYNFASDETKKEIEKIAQSYYNDNIISNNYVGGPYGAYGKFLKNNTAAYTWQVWKNLLTSTLIYETLGDKYGEGIILAQKALDWYWGSNPYSSSLVFGVGDYYVNSGWASYHTIGRHIGIESQNGKHLKGTDGSYASSETTVMGSLAVWNSAVLLDKYRDSLKGVEVFSDEGYKNKRLFLPAGKYSAELLKAYGMSLDEISSAKIPKDFKVKFYSGDNFDGNSEEYDEDISALASTNNRVHSIEVIYTGEIKAPTGANSKEVDEPEEKTPDTTTEPKDETKNNNSKNDNAKSDETKPKDEAKPKEEKKDEAKDEKKEDSANSNGTKEQTQTHTQTKREDETKNDAHKDENSEVANSNPKDETKESSNDSQTQTTEDESSENENKTESNNTTVIEIQNDGNTTDDDTTHTVVVKGAGISSIFSILFGFIFVLVGARGSRKLRD